MCYSVTANSMNFPGLRLLIEGKESFNAEMIQLRKYGSPI